MTPIKLGEICELHYGKSLHGYHDNDPDDASVRVFGTNGPIGWTKKPLTDNPTIVIGRKGAYRGVHYSLDPSWTIDTAYFLTVKNPQIDLKWLYYRLLLLDINRMDTGAAIPSTKREDFYAAKIKVLSPDSQTRIVDILSGYDDLIENNRRRIELLKQSARMLYKEWFVHIRFPGHKHTTINNGTPSGWERIALGDVLKLKRGYDLPKRHRKEGLVPIISSSGTTGFHDVAKAEPPGIVTGRYGTLGQVYLVNTPYWPLNTALYVQDFKGNDPFCLFHLLENTLRGTSSSKAAVPGVNRNDLHRVLVLKPSMKQQRRFSEIVCPVYSQIDTLNNTSKKLADARDLLLPRLMNGAIAV